MSYEEEQVRELELLRKQTHFQYLVIKACVARLASYEIPVDRVRQFLSCIEQDALTGFEVTEKDPALDHLVIELLEKLIRIQSYVVTEGPTA